MERDTQTNNNTDIHRHIYSMGMIEPSKARQTNSKADGKIDRDKGVNLL